MSATPPVLDRATLNSHRPYAGQRWSNRGDPVWELAMMSPRQGDWTEEDYLAVEQYAFVELVDGCLEFLPLPTPYHQLIAQFLARRLEAIVPSRYPGRVLQAPCPVRLWPARMREPDVFYVRPEQIPDLKRPPDGAELAVEIVSEGAANRQRDLVDKRADYARAGVREYWIVDPEAETIIVLALGKKRYRVHGEFKSGDTVTSALLEGFAVSVAAVFAAGKGAG
jgi:Uma2 family endonuclease